jgi:GT2 family glycosyltransferase
VAALNTGISEITTEYIIRIDGDATVETHDWIEKLLKNLDHEQVGMVGGWVIWETGRIHSYGRNIFNEYGLYDMGCCPMESPGKRTFDSIIYKPYGSFSETKKYEVDSILGVCVAFRKEDAISVGGFDTRFNPVWIEDDDFGVLLRKIGKKNIIDPSIHIVHRPSLRGCRKPDVVKNETELENSGKNIKRNKLDISKIRNLFIKNKNITDIKTVNIEDFIHREEDPWRSNILKSHYISWKEKWGFDPINPDLDFIYNKYWNTELCWKLNPDKHKISKKFIEIIN